MFSPLKPMDGDITQYVRQRYSTKAFNPSKKISQADEKAIKELLRFSPSSVNSQPWHFIIASSQAGKERIAAGVRGAHPYNESKMMNASHVIIFCGRADVDDDYQQILLDLEVADGRFETDDQKARQKAGRAMYMNLHRKQLNDVTHWIDKQVYLNLGAFLLGVSTLGIDAVPMEGIDQAAIDAEFGLQEKGLRAVVAVALGYRADDDFNAKLPKSRLPEKEIFTELD